jgi:hypothetical protein
MTMDDRKLDRMARTAGMLKNRVRPGQPVSIYDEEGRELLGASVQGLHLFAEDVLEMVALLRKASAWADTQEAIESAACLRITTDDVALLVEEGMLGVAILDDEPE